MRETEALRQYIFYNHLNFILYQHQPNNYCCNLLPTHKSIKKIPLRIYTHTLSLSLIVIDDWNSLPTPCESFSCLLLLSHDHSFIHYHSSNKIFQYKKNKERNIFYLVNGDRSMLLLPVPLQ